MKRSARMLAALVVTGITFSTGSAALAADSFPFTDVAQSDWYRSYVEYTQQEKLFNGTSDTTFDPARDITRAEFVSVLGRMHTQLTGEMPSVGKDIFPDVSSKAYYAPYVSWAQEDHIVNGFPDGTFHPDEPITREMVAVILDGYINAVKVVPETSVSMSYAYEDAESISAWADTSIKNMTQYGILHGDNTHHFAPQKHATRAEAAAVFTRIYQEIKYQTEKDATYNSIRYSYHDDSSKPFLGGESYQLITDYTTYVDLLKAVNTDNNASFQPLKKEYFDTKNILVVELQHYGMPNCTTKLTDYREDPITQSIDLTFFNDSLYGTTADTVGYLFFIELPDKNAWNTVTIRQADRVSDVNFMIY